MGTARPGGGPATAGGRAPAAVAGLGEGVLTTATGGRGTGVGVAAACTGAGAAERGAAGAGLAAPLEESLRSRRTCRKGLERGRSVGELGVQAQQQGAQEHACGTEAAPMKRRSTSSVGQPLLSTQPASHHAEWHCCHPPFLLPVEAAVRQPRPSHLPWPAQLASATTNHH